MPEPVPAAPFDATPALLPPRATVEGTRRRLLETALVLFAERGYHGVSVRDVTGLVGVKPSSLYAHFASKEHLLAELVRLGHDEHLTALRDMTRNVTPSEQLRGLVDAHVRNHATYPLLARVCAADIGGLSEENLALILAYRLEVVSLFLNAIAAGVDSGDFEPTDPFLTSMAILAMGIRVANWYSGNAAGLEFAAVLDKGAAPAERYTIDEISDAYCELALRMVHVHSV
jgi:AcrR family transcriptional regulator